MAIPAVIVLSVFPLGCDHQSCVDLPWRQAMLITLGVSDLEILCELDIVRLGSSSCLSVPITTIKLFYGARWMKQWCPSRTAGASCCFKHMRHKKTLKSAGFFGHPCPVVWYGGICCTYHIGRAFCWKVVCPCHQFCLLKVHWEHWFIELAGKVIE